MSLPNGLPLQIPGFYYDTQRQRYFRVLPNHLAPRSSDTTSFVTTAHVERVQGLEQARLRENAQNKWRAKRRRKENLLMRSSLSREIGGITAEEGEEVQREIYAQRLIRTKPVDYSRFLRPPIKTFTTYWEGPDTVNLFLGRADTLVARGIYKIDEDFEWREVSMKKIVDEVEQVTSQCTTSTGLLISTSLAGNLIVLNIGTEKYSRISTSFKCIWTSTASPCNGWCIIGTSRNVGLYNLNAPHILPYSFITGSDVFAVEFMKESPTMFLSGARDGGVRLHDRRYLGSSKLKHFINHGSVITHLRALNEKLILAKGPQFCALYDVRFIKQLPAPSRSYPAPTNPVMAYEALCDQYGSRLDLGFDVNAAGDIMAVATTDTNKIELYSTVTGNILENRGSLGKTVLTEPSKLIKFVGDRPEGGRPEFLLAMNGKQVIEKFVYE